MGELQNVVSKFADGLADHSQYFTSSIHAESQKHQRETLSSFDLADFSSQTAQQKIRTKRVFMAVGDQVKLKEEDASTVVNSAFRFFLGDGGQEDIYQQYSVVGTQELYPVYIGMSAFSHVK